MISNSEIKKVSKNLLSNGAWLKFGLIVILINSIILGNGFYMQYNLLSTSTSFASSTFSGLISYFIGSIGFIIFIYLSMRIIFEKSNGSKDFVVGIKSLIKNILFNFMLDLVCFLACGVVSVIISPLVIASFIGSGNTFEIFGVILDIETTITFALVLLILSVVIMYIQYTYFLTFYLNMMEDNDSGITMNMKLSRALMKGNKLRLFMLNFSFIPWIILSVITFGLLFIYVIPYFYTSNAVFFKEIIKNNKEKLDEFNMYENTGIQKMVSNSEQSDEVIKEQYNEDMNTLSLDTEDEKELVLQDNMENNELVLNIETDKIEEDVDMDVIEDLSKENSDLDDIVRVIEKNDIGTSQTKEFIEDEFKNMYKDIEKTSVSETQNEELSVEDYFNEVFSYEKEHDNSDEVDIFSEIEKELEKINK